ncbi:MAG: DDE-type integrase/transposase/recombinase, partial [Gemmatimonadales bacterium]
MATDHAEGVALFRFSVISQAINPKLGKAERGLVVRALAERVHVGPGGEERTLSRGTLDRWATAYRRDGLAGLRPRPRADAGRVRLNQTWMAQAAALRRELPTRSAAQIVDIIGRAHGVWLAERTVRANLSRMGLDRAALEGQPARAYGRFEASRPNEIWIGDVLIGPFVPHPRVAGSRRAKLFLLIDDHSRLLVHGRWMEEENTRAGQEVLKAAITRRGIPENLYLDNGAPFRSAQLERSCAVLGIHLVHSRPYAPQGRGKQERANRYIRERFLAEAMARGISSFAELNDAFLAWAETVANHRIHAETKLAPITRFTDGLAQPTKPSAEALREAFRWSVTRRVTKTATIDLFSNRFSVDPSLVGKWVECRFEPEDLTHIEIYYEGARVGLAHPFLIGRHVHPAVPQAPAPVPGPGPGIDYLGLVEATHRDDSGTGAISYANVALPGFEAEAPDNDRAGNDHVE